MIVNKVKIEELATLRELALKNPVFFRVENLALDDLLLSAEKRTFSPNSVILSANAPSGTLFILLKGSVRVFYTSDEGRRVVVKLFRDPAIFGEMELLSGVPYLESVDAVEKCELLFIPREAALRAFEQSHALCLNMLQDVAARLCIAAQNEKALAFNAVETRLAGLMSTYADFYGLPVTEGIKIRIPLSQDDLADALGAVRRSVTRVLKKWGEMNIITKKGGHYIILNREELEKITDPDLLRIGYRIGRSLKAGS